MSVLPIFIQGVTALPMYCEYLLGKCNTDFQQMTCSRSTSSTNTTCSTTSTTSTSPTDTTTTVKLHGYIVRQ